MDICRLASSALRFSDARCRRQQMITPPPPKKLKQLGASIRPFPSRTLPYFPILSDSSRSTNGTHCLNSEEVQACEQEEAKSFSDSVANSELPKPNWSGVLWRFLRPFPLIATLIQLSSVLARLVVENPHVTQRFDWSMFMKILAVLTTVSCTNFYACAINQIFDIETDKINKPHLPLCSGELPIESAWLIVLGFVAISLLIAGALNSMPFVAFNFFLLLVASLYSIPPFRTKASTFGAPITISMGNGFVQFFTTFAGVGAALGLPFRMSMATIFMSIFTSIFFVSMGIVKDIADVHGDKESNIPTVANIIGVRPTLFIGVGILIVNHFGGVLLALMQPMNFKCNIVVPAHILSIFFVLYHAWKLDISNYDTAQSWKTYLTFLSLYLVHILLYPFI